MDKLTMAHEWAMKFGKSTTIMDRENTVDYAWQYADAMQAEADKRKEKGFPDAIKFERSEVVSKVVELAEKQGLLKRGSWDDVEWQPDWSQAPSWAEHFAVNGDGIGVWMKSIGDPPYISESLEMWFCYGSEYNSLFAPSFDYQGDWRNSLRKRPVID